MSIPLRVLLVEDSLADAELNLAELRLGGYDPIYERVDTPEAMKAALKKGNWEIILSDYVMPRFSGPAALKLVQQMGVDIPFIMVTGQVGEATAIETLTAGAHDYVMKGNMARLVPAVQRVLQDAVLRRERREADEALRRAHEELRLAHAELEQRVEERTAELQRVNEELQNEIVERKQTEEVVRRAAAFNEAAMKNLGEGLYTIDTQGLVTFMNPASERLFGWSFAELRGKKMHDMTHHHYPDGRPFPSSECAGFQVLSHGQQLVDHEDVFIRKDGTFFPVTYSISPMHDDIGRITGLVVVFRDISERKWAEEALRTSEEQFRTMADAIPQLAWIAQPDGFIYWYNRRWYEYTGTTPEQMEGWGWQSVHDPEMVPAVLERWRHSIATGEPFDMEFPLRGANGQFRWFLTRVTPLKDAVGRVVNWFGTNTDISYRLEAEAERQRAEEERERLLAEIRRRAADLDAANKELEAFTYSVAHDLRAPVRHMGGFSKVLMERYADKLDERGKQYLQFVRNGSVKMEQLIDDLLTLTGITRREFCGMPVDLSEMAGSVAAELKNEQPNREVELFIEPGVVASGDPGMLRIVLGNLLGNAWKFTSKRDHAKIEFGMRQQEGGPVFYVHDNGAGFNPAYANKLFRAFERLHSADEFPGTGVGLATVERIIRRHGGRVWAEGEENKGATFYFTLG